MTVREVLLVGKVLMDNLKPKDLGLFFDRAWVRGASIVALLQIEAHKKPWYN